LDFLPQTDFEIDRLHISPPDLKVAFSLEISELEMAQCENQEICQHFFGKNVVKPTDLLER